MRTLLSLVSTAVLCAAAHPASAQNTAATDAGRPLVRAAAFVIDAAAVRTLAIYQFVAPHDAGMPTEVTVADSSGALVAALRLPFASTTRPMTIERSGTDVVLHGDTPSGALTLVLYQNEPAPLGTVIGRWVLGDREGKLRAAR